MNPTKRNCLRVAAVTLTLLVITACSSSNPRASEEQAPDWIRQFGSPAWENASGVAVDEHDNIIFVGSTSGTLAGASYGNRDAFVGKLDQHGNLMWLDQFGTAEADYVDALAIAGDGAIVVVGRTEGALASVHYGGQDAFLSKFDADGNLLWSRQWGGVDEDGATDVAVDAAGNILVVGYTGFSWGTPGSPVVDGWNFIHKYTPSGTLLWATEFEQDHSLRGVATHVEVSPSGVIAVISGMPYFPTDASFENRLSIFDAGGVMRGTQVVNSTITDVVRGIAFDPTGNFILTGSTWGDVSLLYEDGRGSDVFVKKLAPSGVLLWEQVFGTRAIDRPAGVTVDSSGKIYVAASIRAANDADSDFFVQALSSSGEMGWGVQLGTSQLDSAAAIAVDSEGAILVAGTTQGAFDGSNQGEADTFVARLVPEPN